MTDRCPTCHRRHRRTHPQNARYWMLLHLLSERMKPAGEQFSADQWHLWAKSRFLGADDVKLPSGKVLTIPRSTADLSVDEFGEYMDKIEAWAAEKDVWLADREDAA